MNKSELIEAVASKTEMTKVAAGRAVEVVLDTIAEAVAKGDSVSVIGFGTFESLKRAAHHVVIDHARQHDALADRGRHLELEDEDRDDVEEGGEQHRLLRLEHAGGDDGGDRVGRVVETVHEVEQHRQHDQQRDDPEGNLDVFHGGKRRKRAAALQAFSRTMPSMRLATSSQRSEMDSSCS